MESSSPAQGFTLIEILVSVTLLLLLSGLSIANYNAFNTTQAVKQAASDLISNLQAVRTMATAGIKPIACDTLVGYRVNFSDTSYTSQARCLVDGSEQGIGTVNSYVLPTGVVFPPPTPGVITFYSVDKGASVNQTISVVKNGVTMNVYVFTSGMVSSTP